VVFGGRRPELVSTKLVSLAQLVEKHLGLPLYKGEVRTSNWSRPLLESQINYAAGDAYAGFMLYHCMNAKRLDMKPAPPLPIHADKYQAMTRKIPKIGRLYLEPVEEGGNFTPSDVFFGDPTRVDRVGSLENADEACREMAVARKKETTSTSAATMTTRPEKMTANCLDESSQRLYGKLASRRKTLADAASVPLYRVAHNVVLEGLARERPLDTGALLKIRGVGKHQQEKYGDMWIEVIKEFVAADEIGQRATTTAISACTGRPCTGNDSKEKGESAREETPDSSPAFEAPPRPRTAQLHTGLSFTLAETSLSKSVSCSDDSDSSLVLLEFSELSSRRSSGQKRKRAGNRLQASDARAQSMQTVARACGDESREAVGQTMETRIFRNKLVALSKLVGRKVPSRCAEAAQVVSDDTLDSIVAKRPRTHDELRQIGGIEMFVQACVEADVDLLKNIVRFTPAET
jgi:ribonuclease D